MFLALECYPTIPLCFREEQAHSHDLRQRASALSLEQRDTANSIVTEL